jgi:hypothetical protein
MGLAGLTEAIDELSGSDPSAFVDTESIEVLCRQLARLDCVVTKKTAAFDASGGWVPSGARTAAAWLSVRCRLPKPLAKRMVHRGRQLRHLPLVDRAWSAGDLTAGQVDVVARLRSEETADALERDEAFLVEQAGSLRLDEFIKVADYWKQHADPDGAEDDDERRRGRRDVYLESSFEGMWLGKVTLDPISGSIVAGELGRLEREMFEADWAAARDSLGRDPTTADLARSPGQRRADALVEMATRSQMAPVDGRRPAPLFSILVGYETLNGRICELADGTVLAPGALLPWLDQGYFERVVFAPDRRVEVSTTARLFTGATRRAIELRDRECTHPYCDVPASQCQADHIVPFSAGGPTTAENGRILCGAHNRSRNQRPPPGHKAA